MAKLIIYALLTAILAACGQAGQVITATPRAIVSTQTPPPLATTVTPEVRLNPHSECVARTSNFELCDVLSNGQFNPPYFSGMREGRAIASPAGWSFYWSRNVRGARLEDVPNNPPNTGCGGKACVMDIAWWSGVAGYFAGGTNPSGIQVYANQRYLLKATYDVLCLSNQFQINVDAVRIGAEIHSSSSSISYLPARLPARLSAGQEALWLLQARGNDDIVLYVYAAIPFGVCERGSLLTWKSIELLPVPDTYGEAPIRF